MLAMSKIFLVTATLHYWVTRRCACVKKEEGEKCGWLAHKEFNVIWCFKLKFKL